MCSSDGCCLSYKDTILKANHSSKANQVLASLAVAYPTKILFWKRITAQAIWVHCRWTLLLILQRYYFESESQPFIVYYCLLNCCCLSYKDTILKANHSLILLLYWAIRAVAYPTKILFWKRITASLASSTNSSQLLLILQRYYFESESQPMMKDMYMLICCCLSYKDTILKANHSENLWSWPEWNAVAYPTKILFWKRITATISRLYLIPGCCLSYKDTIFLSES